MKRFQFNTLFWAVSGGVVLGGCLGHRLGDAWIGVIIGLLVACVAWLLLVRRKP